MYSQAVMAGNTMAVAGTTGVDVKTGTFAGPTVTELAHAAWSVDRPVLPVSIAMIAVID